MFFYKIYGMLIKTDLEFRQLIKATEDDVKKNVDIEIYSGEVDQDVLDAEADGKKYDFGDLAAQKIDRCWLANSTCYLIVTNGNRIIYKFKPGKNEEYLRSYILGFGMSMIALQRGEVAMHCSAICKNDRAVIICGESGAGKSTLTSQFLKAGWKLMADDMTFIETIDNVAYVKPAFPYQKLCRDAAVAEGYDLDKEIYINEEKDKFLVRYRGDFSENNIRLDHMIYLGMTSTDDVVLEEMTGLKSFYACAGNLFLRNLLKEDKYSPGIGNLCLKLASAIKIYCVYRPMGVDSLSRMTEVVSNIID